MSVLAHTRVGTGPRAMFLLHGFLGSARNPASLARGLAQRLTGCSVIALDLTGHGDSPPLPPRPDLAVIANDALDTAHALDAPPPWTMIGHSLGGRVALRAARLEPTALAHLTLLDVTPSPRPAGGEVAAIVKALGDAPERARDRQAFRAWFRQAGLAPASVSTRQPAASSRRPSASETWSDAPPRISWTLYARRRSTAGQRSSAPISA